MASLKRKQTLFSGVARKAKEIRQNSTNLAFDNKTNARKGSKIATADARLAIYVFYLSMHQTLHQDQTELFLLVKIDSINLRHRVYHELCGLAFLIIHSYELLNLHVQNCIL